MTSNVPLSDNQPVGDERADAAAFVENFEQTVLRDPTAFQAALVDLEKVFDANIAIARGEKPATSQGSN